MQVTFVWGSPEVSVLSTRAHFRLPDVVDVFLTSYSSYCINKAPDKWNTRMTERNSEHTLAVHAVIVEAENTETEKGSTACVELNGDAIYLNCRQLHVLPCQLFDENVRHSLCRLYLQRNLLQSLPSEIQSLQQLRELYLQSNRLEVLPEEICQLRQLETLDASDNKLMSIPQSIGRLHNLQRLRLAHNHLKQLPAEIGMLKALESLEVSHNQLQRLPQQLAQCSSLRQLCVDTNHLATLPRQLCHLRHLTEISASHNQLLFLPQDLGRIPTLRAVYVDNNPYLTAVPASTLLQTIGFCRSGQAAIREYLLTLQCHVVLDSGPQGQEAKVVALPAEIRNTGHVCTNCVPLLLELALRVVSRLVHSSATCIQEGELPSDLLSLLRTPTAHCRQCATAIFVSAFPAVFRAQLPNYKLLLLGLCCSSACVRQCTLIHLPLLYPRLEDLALALVVA